MVRSTIGHGGVVAFPGTRIVDNVSKSAAVGAVLVVVVVVVVVSVSE
jgi:uncharacterized membrane protein YfcA